MKTALTIYLGKDSAFAAVDVNDQIDLLALGESEAGLSIADAVDPYDSETKLSKEDLTHTELFMANLFSDNAASFHDRWQGLPERVYRFPGCVAGMGSSNFRKYLSRIPF